MPLYRVELWDHQKKPVGAYRLKCNSDVEAIAEARTFTGPDRAVLLLRDRRPITAFRPLGAVPS